MSKRPDNSPRNLFLQRADGECRRTWCEERLYVDDVEYIRADFVEGFIERMDARHAALRAAVAELLHNGRIGPRGVDGMLVPCDDFLAVSRILHAAVDGAG